jgi:hypothetical protein
VEKQSNVFQQERLKGPQDIMTHAEYLQRLGRTSIRHEPNKRRKRSPSLSSIELCSPIRHPRGATTTFKEELYSLITGDPAPHSEQKRQRVEAEQELPEILQK